MFLPHNYTNEQMVGEDEVRRPFALVYLDNSVEVTKLAVTNIQQRVRSTCDSKFSNFPKLSQ